MYAYGKHLGLAFQVGMQAGLPGLPAWVAFVQHCCLGRSPSFVAPTGDACRSTAHPALLSPLPQVVDDILDFTQSEAMLGKPQGQDLASGNLTAPAIYALQARRGRAGPAQLRKDGRSLPSLVAAVLVL
jgi:hypothetical protein